jgi:predicted nucleic acid-binding protein
MNLFIDTNVYLSFYHLSSDDLDELKKLVVIVRKGRVRLFMPEQVMMEFRRNRSGKIADALKRLREQRLNLQFPQISRHYDEYEQLRAAQRDYEKHHAALVARVEEDIASRKLKADGVIQQLIDIAHLIPTSTGLIEGARLRMDLGNPPGKKGSLGDAVNWEALLSAVPSGEDLHFVTEDNDYSSPLDPNSFEPFLLEEWHNNKGANLLAYRRLSVFFQQHYPDIDLATETEKDQLVVELAASPRFADTHRIIAALSTYSDFSPYQVEGIVSAALSNNQVYWIIDDPDVSSFVKDVIRGKDDMIDPASLSKLRGLLKEPVDDIPF